MVSFKGQIKPYPPPPSGGYSTKFYTRRLRLEVQPLVILYSIFGRKGTPFVYLLLTNGTPITNNFASLLTAVNAPKLPLSRTAITSICKSFRAFFKDPNDGFPYPFRYLKPENSATFGRSLTV